MRAMDKTFEYRIYPSAEQEALLQKTFGCCRWVYNRVLAMRRDEYAWTGKSRHINSYITQIPAWKRADAPWLSEVDSMALQQSLRDLDKAFKNFFRAPGKVGFPKFKSKRAGRKSYRTNGVGIIDARHVRLPKLGTVRARVSRPVEGASCPRRSSRCRAASTTWRYAARTSPPRTRRPRPSGSWESMREYTT